MSKEIKALRLKKYHLDPLIKFLDVPMHGPTARARNKFIKLLSVSWKEAEDERVKLLNSLCEKDKKGVPIMEDRVSVKNGQKLITPHFKLSLKDQEKFTKVNEAMWLEDAVFDVLPSNEDNMFLIKNAVLNLRREFDATEGAIYDEICEAFELLK